MQQLQKEIKDLKFEVSQKEDALSVKIETIRDLQDSLDNLKRQHFTENDKLKRENIELRELLSMKESAVS